MKFLKFVIYAIISFTISCWLFDASVLAMSFIFLGLNCIMLTSKSDFTAPKKTKVYGIALIVCVSGAVLIVLGNKILNNDIVIIIGALMFAPTFAAILIREIIALISYSIRLREK